ncbi:Integrase catalytic region [Gallionella capsiferriformans ES-2]|uniref:Integrase catalytic region n=2 Tax=Gallionella TaxID=96 RepID=D9SD49_GALCS|nr:IS21 family transposase [Gallionella capsiferriformans]ADL54738.1 Integrase catalytic region [Gallionella capsiferriformans ES-2]ADL56706.1 Integrase catalytic region [Gallionella capsiferriformans ES-2]
MRKIRQVLRLTFEMEQSKRAIASSIGISRDSVSDYLTRSAVAGLSWPLPSDMDDAELERRLFPSLPKDNTLRKSEPDWMKIHQELKQKGATLQGFHEEYLAEYPTGLSYSYFCQRHREFEKTLKRSMRQIHVAGDKVFVDYVGPTMKITDIATGEIQEAQIFVGVLGASCYIYADAVWSQSLPNWIDSHARMFEHFGGVPAVVVCDNLKSAVIRASKTDPTINSSYQDMADHYGTMIIPARPYKPKDKAHAENGVLIVERWILFRLRKRIFTNLADLNDAIRELLVDVNNRPFKKLPGCRRSVFEAIDQPALRPLALEKYTLAEFRRFCVDHDYHIDLGDRHLYSVPYTLIRKNVDVRVTATTVEILHGGRRIATHPRANGPGKTTDKEHMPSSHRYQQDWNEDKALGWALGIGPNTHSFLKLALSKLARREQSMRADSALKSMGNAFGEDRLESACARALAIGANHVSRVRSILEKNLDQQPISAPAVQEANFDHDNIRGPQYYH